MKLTDPSTLCLLCLAAIVVLLLFRTRFKLADQRQRRESDAKAGRPAEASKITPSPDDLARWEVAMHETARELSAQLDAKLSLLQALIAEADRAAARLEAALDRGTTVPEVQSEPATHAHVVEAQSGPAAHVPEVQSEPATHAPDLDDSGLDLQGRQAPAAEDVRGRNRDEIYQLADYGFAPEEIARRVGSPVGEIELILSLRGNAQ